MNKVVKWGVLLLLGIALLIKLSLWLSVRSAMQTAILQLSPIMHISYGGITSSFDGRVGLEQLKIRVPAMRDTLYVQHAELRFRSLGELLRFKERLDQGKFPDQLTARLQGLQLAVHGPFMQQLYDVPAERSVFTAMSEVACGDVSHIGTTELLEMGYRTLESDVEFSYRFKPGAQTLSFDLHADTRDMLDMRSVVTLENMPDNPGDLRVDPPRVAAITLEMNDNQYQRKVQDYCAGKLGQSTEAYLKTAVEQFDRVLRSQRIALSPALLEAYGDYLAEPTSLRLEFQPTEGMAWGGLQFFAARDVLAMLRPVVLVNQQSIEPQFEWIDPSRRQQSGALERVVAEVGDEHPVTTQYEFVKVADLAGFAGKRLQFVTFDGVYYQGILHKVEDGKAFLSVQFGTGSAEMFLRLDKIDKVRVLL